MHISQTFLAEDTSPAILPASRHSHLSLLIPLSLPTSLLSLSCECGPQMDTNNIMPLLRSVESVSELVIPFNGSATLQPRPLSTLLPHDTTAFFHYRGSMTTPGCQENVYWVIFEHSAHVIVGQVSRWRVDGRSDGRSGILDRLDCSIDTTCSPCGKQFPLRHFLTIQGTGASITIEFCIIFSHHIPNKEIFPSHDSWTEDGVHGECNIGV